MAEIKSRHPTAQEHVGKSRSPPGTYKSKEKEEKRVCRVDGSSVIVE